MTEIRFCQGVIDIGNVPDVVIANAEEIDSLPGGGVVVRCKSDYLSTAILNSVLGDAASSH